MKTKSLGKYFHEVSGQFRIWHSEELWVYTGHLVLLGQWNLGGCNGLNMKLWCGKTRIATKFLWGNPLEDCKIIR
jgi:hypothetical protein